MCLLMFFPHIIIISGILMTNEVLSVSKSSSKLKRYLGLPFPVVHSHFML